MSTVTVVIQNAPEKQALNFADDHVAKMDTTD